MVTKASAKTAPRAKARPAAKKAPPAAASRTGKPRKPQPWVAKTVARVIEASPLGKAAAVTQAIVQSRKNSQQSRRVRNKVVVDTGASSGIGEDCALKLAATGATVILAARTPANLQATLTEIEARGGKAHACACERPGPKPGC